MRRVVVVGMLDSIHVARWLEQFAEEQLEIWLFPSSPMRRLHSRISRLLEGQNTAKFQMQPWVSWGALPLWFADKITANFIRAFLLRQLVTRVQPSVVHLIELQNAGYIGLRAFSKLEARPFKLIATNYGSDIFFFGRTPRHHARLQRLLSLCDYYSSECERDVVLARNLGFEGTALPVRPNAGGFTEDTLSSELLPDSHRNLILIKGYHGWAGRAKIALEALLLIEARISGLQIVIFSCDRSVARQARKLARLTGLNIETHSKGALDHSSILELQSRAKIYVGLSLSDGISTSLLEAMAMGAIPVQTATACCEEWFGETGVRVDSLRVEVVASSILKGLELARNPENRSLNREIIRAKALDKYVREAALEFYR